MEAQFQALRELIVERDLSLRAHLDERFEQIDARFVQIDARFEQIDARFEQIEERDRSFRAYVEERFDQIHEYVDERTRDMETRVLTGFERWATSFELKIKPMSVRISAIEDRMDNFDRYLKDFGKSSF